MGLGDMRQPSIRDYTLLVCPVCGKQATRSFDVDITDCACLPGGDPVPMKVTLEFNPATLRVSSGC